MKLSFSFWLYRRLVSSYPSLLCSALFRGSHAISHRVQRISRLHQIAVRPASLWLFYPDIHRIPVDPFMAGSFLAYFLLSSHRYFICFSCCHPQKQKFFRRTEKAAAQTPAYLLRHMVDSVLHGIFTKPKILFPSYDHMCYDCVSKSADRCTGHPEERRIFH